MVMSSSSANLNVPPSPTIRSSPIPPSSSPFIGNIDLVQQWDEATVGEWLKSVNCGKYRQIFASNNINGDALLDCDQNILKEVGVTKVGDRIRIMVAVKSLRAHAVSLSKVPPESWRLDIYNYRLLDMRLRHRWMDPIVLLLHSINFIDPEIIQLLLHRHYLHELRLNLLPLILLAFMKDHPIYDIKNPFQVSMEGE